MEGINHCFSQTFQQIIHGRTAEGYRYVNDPAPLDLTPPTAPSYLELGGPIERVASVATTGAVPAFDTPYLTELCPKQGIPATSQP